MSNDERYTRPSLESQEAVKEKYHFLQWAAITVMNTQHVISASKKKVIFSDEMLRAKLPG